MYGQDCSEDTPLKTIPSTFTAFANGIVDGVEFLSSNGVGFRQTGDNRYVTLNYLSINSYYLELMLSIMALRVDYCIGNLSFSV